MKKLRFACLLVSAGAVGACRSGGIALEQPVGDTHHVVSATGGAKPVGTDEPGANVVVFVGPALATKCQVEQRRAEFKTSEEKLLASGVDVLASVGRCLARDPDASLFVVGHTDPRAEEDYDHKLGLLRADRARAAVVAQGVQVERIAIGSRGALDAEGTDEATWEADRRIELFLAKPRSLAGVDAPQYGPGPGAAATPAAAPAAAAAGSRAVRRAPTVRATGTPATRR